MQYRVRGVATQAKFGGAVCQHASGQRCNSHCCLAPQVSAVKTALLGSTSQQHLRPRVLRARRARSRITGQATYRPARGHYGDFSLPFIAPATVWRAWSQFQQFDGSTNCEKCQSGRYMPTTVGIKDSTALCVTCAPGKYTAGVAGATTCMEASCLSSQWGSWGPCSKSCGTGTQIRRRVVTRDGKHGETYPALSGVARL